MASYLARWTYAKKRFETEAGKVVGKKLAKPGKTGIFWIRKSSGMEKVCTLLDDTKYSTLEKAKSALKTFEAQSNEYKKLLKASATDDADYKQVKKQINELSEAMDEIYSDFNEEWIRRSQDTEGKAAVVMIKEVSQKFLDARKELRTIAKSCQKLRGVTSQATDDMEEDLRDVNSLLPGEESDSGKWKKYLKKIQAIQVGLEKSEVLISQMNGCYETVSEAYLNAKRITLFKPQFPHKQKSENAQKECEKFLVAMTTGKGQADDDHLYAYQCEKDNEQFREMVKDATARIAKLEKEANARIAAEKEKAANRIKNRGKTRL